MTSPLFNDQTLRNVLESAKLGHSLWTLSSQPISILWSPTLEQIYGLPPGVFAGTFDTFIDLIYEDDRDQVRAEILRL
ncbi:MAG: PAS domain-containing protein [Oculatellaceae cyanobacterium Prado106]|jgi:hypothetical protein|nr:PAS domain-containing protein [Oculatellaceae cyanobacterium Prado106]